ncbi:MAG: hypothetical protein P8P55_03780 [Flavobacteriaceae bacterium]|nr:hypothetical protein [Flavobacteriaceae bacterium]MDG1393930.1 hypothetical protein [Flavobacteriaceae bacterium]
MALLSGMVKSMGCSMACTSIPMFFSCRIITNESVTFLEKRSQVVTSR